MLGNAVASTAMDPVNCALYFEHLKGTHMRRILIGCAFLCLLAVLAHTTTRNPSMSASVRSELASIIGGENNKECLNNAANCTLLAQAASHAAGLNDPLCGTSVTGCTPMVCAHPGCSTNCTGDDAGMTMIKSCKSVENVQCTNDMYINCGDWFVGHCPVTYSENPVDIEVCSSGIEYECAYGTCVKNVGAIPQSCGSYWTCAIIY